MKRRGITGPLTVSGLGLLSLAYIYPLVMVAYNSFKKKAFISRTPFALPTAQSFAGLQNYQIGLRLTQFAGAMGCSVAITVLSVGLILLCTSMCAWFISRVQNKATKAIYLACIFSMVVPFQMVMFTLSKVANLIGLNNPFGIVVVYLGFGAGLAVFMFCGFMKSIPIQIEEAAMIDGCNPIQTYFHVVFPILRPTMISVGILEAMWVWNDYLLPTLVLDIKQYRTVSMLIQYFRGSYGRVEMGPMMACIMLTILPIIIVYLLCQKYIIKGVASGAVKG